LAILQAFPQCRQKGQPMNDIALMFPQSLFLSKSQKSKGAQYKMIKEALN
jgi:hypothetical protein